MSNNTLSVQKLAIERMVELMTLQLSAMSAPIKEAGAMEELQTALKALYTLQESLR